MGLIKGMQPQGAMEVSRLIQCRTFITLALSLLILFIVNLLLLLLLLLLIIIIIIIIIIN